MKLVLSIALFLSFLNVVAQDAEIFKPDSIKKEIKAVEIHSSLRINGQLNEEAWQKAEAAPAFIQIEPFQGIAPNHATEVKVLYNKHYLYFGIFSKDSLVKKSIR